MVNPRQIGGVKGKLGGTQVGYHPVDMGLSPDSVCSIHILLNYYNQVYQSQCDHFT
jgi:hypothetical protein